MAKQILGTLAVILACSILSVAARRYCNGREGEGWYCEDECCYRYDGCCEDDTTAASYWYAWFLISLIFLICLCACIGCGGYSGYRRNYYVRTVEYSPHVPQTSRTRIVTTTNLPATAPAAKPYSHYYSATKDSPPPYTPATAPPPYSKEYQY